MSLNTQLQKLWRKLLFSWAHVKTFPEKSNFDSINNILTIYVLADRGLSDLLVLQQVCFDQKLPNPLYQQDDNKSFHAVYSVASKNPLIDWLNKRKKDSLMLQQLIQQCKNNPQFDVQFIPTSVFWGRPLAKQKHWLKVLFNDTWIVTSRFRRFITILAHGKRCELFFSEAISFRGLAQLQNHSAEAINEALSDILATQTEVIFGPKMLSHKALTHQVLSTDEVTKHIKARAKKAKISVRKAHKIATSYCDEIFCNSTQISVNLMLRLLNKFWNKFYSGIVVYHIDRVKEIAKTHQLVYVPCHRSHIDYLLLSYVIHQQGLAIPTIAAGSNLNLPVIGNILRGGGAFFIRRSFKGNTLYSKIMNAYVAKLVDLGAPIEYFIEGGRSRTGRLLQPKLGMLAMTVQAYLKTQQKPLAFIPVYIGYEKLMEGRSYLGELYGDKKQKETLLGSLRSIYRLKGQFGKVSSSFGKPILLNDILQSNNPNWASEACDYSNKPDWYMHTVTQLSTQIMQHINQACVINPVNLIATILLAMPRQSIDLSELMSQAEFYTHCIQNLEQLKSISIPDVVDQAQVERIQKQGLMRIRKHPLGDIAFLKPEDSILMSYYRNNSLHALIIPSLIVCCLINSRQVSIPKLLSIVRYVYPFLKSELHLQWDDDELEAFVLNSINYFVAEGYLSQKNETLKRLDRSAKKHLPMLRLAHIVQPILERYYMTFIILWQSSEKPLTKQELETKGHLLAQKISMIYGINSPDFFDRTLFTHFIATLFKMNYVIKDGDGKLQFSEHFNNINLDIRTLLSIEVRNSILQML